MSELEDQWNQVVNAGRKVLDRFTVLFGGLLVCAMLFWTYVAAAIANVLACHDHDNEWALALRFLCDSVIMLMVVWLAGSSLIKVYRRLNAQPDRFPFCLP